MILPAQRRRDWKANPTMIDGARQTVDDKASEIVSVTAGARVTVQPHLVSSDSVELTQMV